MRCCGAHYWRATSFLLNKIRFARAYLGQHIIIFGSRNQSTVKNCFYGWAFWRFLCTQHAPACCGWIYYFYYNIWTCNMYLLALYVYVYMDALPSTKSIFMLYALWYCQCTSTYHYLFPICVGNFSRAIFRGFLFIEWKNFVRFFVESIEWKRLHWIYIVAWKAFVYRMSHIHGNWSTWIWHLCSATTT